MMRSDPLQFLADELESLRAHNALGTIRVLDGPQLAKASIDGRVVVNLASNNYLGLTTHPRLREAALEATRQFGVGAGSVRTIAGTLALHEELERRLAEEDHAFAYDFLAGRVAGA